MSENSVSTKGNSNPNRGVTMTRALYMTFILLFLLPSHPAFAVCPPEEINSYAELSDWVGKLDKKEDYVDLVISGCGLMITGNVGINRGLERVWEAFDKLQRHDFFLIPLLADPCGEFQCFGLSSEQFVRAAISFGEHKKLEVDDSRKNIALIVSLIGMAIAIISLVISTLKFRREVKEPKKLAE